MQMLQMIRLILYLMIIKADTGNVGIGTTAPGAYLDVKRAYETSKWALIVNQSNVAPLAAATHDQVLIQRQDVASMKIYDVGDGQLMSLAAGDGDSDIASVGPLKFWTGGSISGQPYAGLGGTLAMTITGGNISIAGSLSKGSGSFLIDHPLDPANKVLRHSFTESPDMKNIYDGIATLHEKGEAVIELPAYFEALSRDFRYQLTPVGSPVLVYVKAEIQGNKFVIAAESQEKAAGLKVSWQVTGIRKDPYAVKHPIVVEEEKGKDSLSKKGEYIHPDCYAAKKDK